MNDAERDSKLVLRAEAALAAAPLREPDWENLATRIEGALASAGRSDDSLLLPPLPESVEDGQQITTGDPSAERLEREAKSTESERGGSSLADLARAAVARRSSNDAVNLVKESLALASQGRAQVEADAVAATAVAAKVVVERERPTTPPARQPAALDTRGPWIGVAIAAVGLAAGFGLYLASRQPAPTVAPMVSSASPPSAATETSLAPPRPLAAETRPNVPATPAEEEASIAPLPAPEPAAAPAHESAAAVKSQAPVAETRPSAVNTGARSHAEKVVLEEDAPATTSAPPKPASSAKLRPAELNTANTVSDRPSTGAAQAAVGAVLGAARACIAGQPEASSATLVFGSSGEVTSVNVSGPAEGTPAAACIKSALGKARVQPFAASSFSLGVTVRPL
jgi:hypothetical protein